MTISVEISLITIKWETVLHIENLHNEHHDYTV